jgi:hypothetical protein
MINKYFLKSTAKATHFHGKHMVIEDNLYDNPGGVVVLFTRPLINQEKNMDMLQKIIIFVVVALVVSGLIWFIFIAH